PAPQRGIAVEVESPLPGQPPDEHGDVGAFDTVLSRRPQQVTVTNLALRLHIADGATSRAVPAMWPPHKRALRRCCPSRRAGRRTDLAYMVSSNAWHRPFRPAG